MLKDEPNTQNVTPKSINKWNQVLHATKFR